MNTTNNEKKTRTPLKEKRAPRLPAAGYTCPECAATGLAPSDFVRSGRCVDCATWADLSGGAYAEEL
jgi:hypothetical protein